LVDPVHWSNAMQAVQAPTVKGVGKFDFEVFGGQG
jgi:hypothetical protein